MSTDRVFRELVDICADGLAVLDEQGCFVMVNGAAAHVLDIPAEELPGRLAPFDVSGASVDGAPRARGYWGDRRSVAWTPPSGPRRELEYRSVSMAGGMSAVWFSDVTQALRQQHRLTSIVRAASSVADAGSLRVTLDAVAREIQRADTIAAVQILAIDDPAAELRVLGMAGLSHAADFTERLSECRRRGARVRFMDAVRDRKPVVVMHRKAAIMADPAWAPLHDIMGEPDWDSFVSMPLLVRGRPLGVINAYYRPGENPGPSSLTFLEAMADHAAVAIDTASLLAHTRSEAELGERRRLARELHDSVVQQLFSMRMQAQALCGLLSGDDPDAARMCNQAQELADLAQNALADLRGLVFELRPLDLAERGLVYAVRAHAASLEARTALAVTVQAPGQDEFEALSVDIQEDLHRIVQEALHNVVKHAGASEVHVRFDKGKRGGLTVEVTDDGCGASTDAPGPPRDGETPAPGEIRAPGETLGIVSMRERAQRCGGRLVAGPRQSGGWRVFVTLPSSGTPVPDAIEDVTVDAGPGRA